MVQHGLDRATVRIKPLITPRTRIRDPKRQEAKRGETRGPEMESQLIHHELSAAIIGAAMTVLNTLRPGLDEKRSEKALVNELHKRGQKVEPQREFPVPDDGQLIGTLKPDLIVDQRVIADPKVVSNF